MNRTIRRLAAVAALLFCATAARAEILLDGVVTYGACVTQRAAKGGIVASVAAEAGAYVQIGDAVATLSLQRYYAPCDGTVERIFADLGESATNATEEYGGALTLMPESRYVIYTTAEDAYESPRTSHIVSGQTVYMKCTNDGTHRGTGSITQIDGDIFTVEATGGVFYNGETVYVYMEDDYDSADLLGKGTVVAVSAMNVEAEGDVAKLYVSEGDFVEKGQLLFETLGALAQNRNTGDLTLAAEANGYATNVYIAAGETIERGALLMSICPQENLIVTTQVPESVIAAVRAGDSALLSFELMETTLRLTGTVTALS